MQHKTHSGVHLSHLESLFQVREQNQQQLYYINLNIKDSQHKRGRVLCFSAELNAAKISLKTMSVQPQLNGYVRLLQTDRMKNNKLSTFLSLSWFDGHLGRGRLIIWK